jgi:hypothetical protein
MTHRASEPLGGLPLGRPVLTHKMLSPTTAIGEAHQRGVWPVMAESRDSQCSRKADDG